MRLWNELKTRLRKPLQVRILDAHTYQVRFDRQATLGRLLSLVMGSHLVLLSLVVLIIFFTPVREWIPGYIDNDYKRKQQELLTKLRVLEDKTARQDSFINALQRASGYVPPDSNAPAATPGGESPEPVPSEPARAQIFRPVTRTWGGSSVRTVPASLRWPVRGTVSRSFDPAQHHFAVDIATAEYSTVHAVEEGFVILTEYSALTGHVIGIEHTNGMISFYKHNQRLLKQLGEYVFADEAIATVGNTGQHTTGPHLHLEFWLEGKPVNPMLYLRNEP